ncbi:MAG: hypothetical protein RTU92_03810 [Candidatus Thorarchaeota archaeon]
MDVFIETLVLSAFIISTLLLVYLLRSRRYNKTFGTILDAKRSSWSIQDFLEHRTNRPHQGQAFSFKEGFVTSSRYRIKGKFDQAILYWTVNPILEAVIERKFPRRILPDNARKEDVFQAELYALALAEMGAVAADCKIIVIYCLQKEASVCVDRNRDGCLNCRTGRRFVSRLNLNRVTKKLDKLNNEWYGSKTPRAKPSRETCIICPYSRKRGCKHSAI